MTLDGSRYFKSMPLYILTRFHIKILIMPMQSTLNFLLGISSVFISKASIWNWQDNFMKAYGVLRKSDIPWHFIMSQMFAPSLHSVDPSLSHLQTLMNTKTDESHLSSVSFNEGFLSFFYFLKFYKFIFNRSNFILQGIKCTLERNTWLMGFLPVRTLQSELKNY